MRPGWGFPRYSTAYFRCESASLLPITCDRLPFHLRLSCSPVIRLVPVHIQSIARGIDLLDLMRAPEGWSADRAAGRPLRTTEVLFVGQRRPAPDRRHLSTKHLHIQEICRQ